MQFLISPTGAHLEIMNMSADPVLPVQQFSRLWGLCDLQLHIGCFGMRIPTSSWYCTGTWNLKQSGYVYSITAGPYGTILALCWAHREDPRLEAVNLVLLSADATGQSACSPGHTWHTPMVASVKLHSCRG